MDETFAPADPGVYAAIDVGTNTVKLTIASMQEDGTWVPVREEARTTRLGEGIAGGCLHDEAIRRTVDVLSQYAAICRAARVQAIAAVATAAVRQARNRDEFVHAAAEAGIPVEILSAGDEARLSFLAVRRDPLWQDFDTLRVLDIGGGSTEIALGAGNAFHSASLPVGVVPITEDVLRSDPPPAEQVREAEQLILEALAHAKIEASPCPTVGVGGTAAYMAAVKQGRSLRSPEQIHGSVLNRQDVEQQVALYASMPAQARGSIPGLDAERAGVILAGAITLRVMMDWFSSPLIHVSGRGLRWGLLYERFGTTTAVTKG